MNVNEEASRVKARLRAATSKDQVEDIANGERALVREMKSFSEEGETMAIQVANLKHRRLIELCELRKGRAA